jgi:hypothetical protein
MERKGIVQNGDVFWTKTVGWSKDRSKAAVMSETEAKHFIWQFTPAGLRANHGETIAKTFKPSPIPVFVPETELTVSVSRAAASVVGLDDTALMADIKREWKKNEVLCTGTPEALRYLACVLFDYSGQDGDDIGEGFHPARRRACGTASKKIATILGVTIK